MKKVLILAVMMCEFAFGQYKIDDMISDCNELFREVPRYEEIFLGEGKRVVVDMKLLLCLTAGIESDFGRYPYGGRVAKTYMQLEKASTDHYVGISGTGISGELKDENAMKLAYAVIKAKMRYHNSYLQKHRDMMLKDPEWGLYKLFYNSVHGASTYRKWKRIRTEYEDRLREAFCADEAKRFNGLTRKDICDIIIGGRFDV